MRVRFFPIGRETSTLVVDRLPFELSKLPGRPQIDGLVSEVGGTLVLRLDVPEARIRINGAHLTEGPVMPGDRLAVDDREFVVSYERMTRAQPVFARYDIPDSDAAARDD